MKDIIHTLIFLMVILILGLYLASLLKRNDFVEGFGGLFSPGKFPLSVDRAILDDYPQIGKNITSNNNYNQIWQDYPVFALGSYDQITNNQKYIKNPDNGTCIRADFCGAVYKDKKVKSNVIEPLPPADEGTGARVGYFRTEPNELYFSIPTNENILY